MKKSPGNCWERWESLDLPENLKIESLGNRVGGIARPDGYPAIFVRGALPGEEVTVRVTGGKKSFLEAEILSLGKTSPHRIDPFCVHYGTCGGCSLQHLSYQRELHWKREWVVKALRYLGSPEVKPVIPSPDVQGYRNRVTFDIHGGRLTLHAFRGDPIPVDLCPLMNSNSRKALEELKRGEYPKTADRISLRGSVNTDDHGAEFFCRGKWTRTGSITEVLNGVRFPVPCGGFFQVNSGAAEILVNKVTELAAGAGGKVLDLYGGVGAFGIPLALKGNAVDSVEMNHEASLGCAEAAKMNDVPRNMLKAIRQRDRTFLSDALRNGTKYDLLVTDPPRAGMGIRTARQVRRLAPETIIYVSCNPFTAARDIAILVEGGYRISDVAPVDMFPRTDHVETVILLEGKSR